MRALKILGVVAVVSCIASFFQVKAVNYLDVSADVVKFGTTASRTASVRKVNDSFQQTNNFVMYPRRNLKMEMYRSPVSGNPYVVLNSTTVSPGSSMTIQAPAAMWAGDWYYLTFRSSITTLDSTNVRVLWIVD